ncbi:hypothetical protein BGX21_010456 [Mortierella sp. AD011]|nr:hypothetical protein BGX20_007982 [Mortierella sp. AD010]KAF9402337.1 hypothetical protein BGX21_010456 [Mortierella sp. AD011]
MTVGAIDRDDTVADYSNWGSCEAIYAPGSAVISIWIGSNSATHVRNGTSMASPHVTVSMTLLLRDLADMILKSVTKFSLGGQLVADKIATSANWPASPSDVQIDSERGKQPPIVDFHGKALARNLV